MKKFKIIFKILSYLRKILLKLLNSCNDFLKSLIIFSKLLIYNLIIFKICIFLIFYIFLILNNLIIFNNLMYH